MGNEQTVKEKTVKTSEEGRWTSTHASKQVVDINSFAEIPKSQLGFFTAIKQDAADADNKAGGSEQHAEKM